MPEWVVPVLVIMGLCLLAAGFLGFMSFRAYSGRWTWFLTNRPFLVPVGRYWGLLTCALWAACAVWLAFAASYLVWSNGRYGNMSPVESFLVTCPFIILVGGAGLLFSWWMPFRWRPQWLLDHDRLAERDAPARTRR